MQVDLALDYTAGDRGYLGFVILCPVCGFNYSHLESHMLIEGHDNYEAGWGMRGDLVRLKYNGECGHTFDVCIGFHKGENFIFCETKDRVNYREYINSPEWKEKADAAKERAGHKCQVCNKAGRLDAHHRTYERLGDELPDDITVLCHDCHELYELNRKAKKAANNGTR